MKTQTILSFLAVALASGCATTNKQLVTNEQLMQEIRGFREENLALRAELEAQKQQPQRVEQQAAEQFEQFAPAAVAQQMPEIPPAQPILPGPPQNMAWPHTPPNGCEAGPFRLLIKNWYRGYYVRIFIDGDEVVTRSIPFPDKDGVMMTPIPPRFNGNDPTRTFACLNHLGEHTISGVIYANRMGVLVEISRFNENIKADASNDGQIFDLLDRLL